MDLNKNQWKKQMLLEPQILYVHEVKHLCSVSLSLCVRAYVSV